jgi:cobalt-zinc-cadmium efflux system membrane fusion protein
MDASKLDNHKRASAWRQVLIGAGMLALAFGAFVLVPRQLGHEASANTRRANVEKGASARFYPTPAQWASLAVEPVATETFREELVTEGKIAVDEDHATAIYSPYTGRVTKLLVAPGDKVNNGQPLFVLEAADSVQIQNDFIAALSAYNKARSQVSLTDTVEQRQHGLYDSKATSLREWQQAQADLTAARLDLQSAQTALEANRNRLRIIGKSDAEIDEFQHTMAISPETKVFAPLSGTVVQRKIGPGQYIAAGSGDPVLMIGDLSTVWLAAYVRESDADKVKVGQPVKFSVLAQPGRAYEAQIKYVDASIDPTSRRRMVRAEIPNTDGLLTPEMFATVKIVIGEDVSTSAVPIGAVIYEGDVARVWVVNEDRSVELRPVSLGLSNDSLIQVLAGLPPGEKIITKGSLFIDRMAAGPQS